MATLKELRQEYTAARATITALDGELATEWNEIGDKAFDEGRSLSDAESARIKEIEDTQDILSARLKDLALNYLSNLNTADDVDALNAKILAVKEKLDEDLERLERIARYAQAVANIPNALAKLRAKIADLVL